MAVRSVEERELKRQKSIGEEVPPLVVMGESENLSAVSGVLFVQLVE